MKFFVQHSSSLKGMLFVATFRSGTVCKHAPGLLFQGARLCVGECNISHHISHHSCEDRTQHSTNTHPTTVCTCSCLPLLFMRHLFTLFTFLSSHAPASIDSRFLTPRYHCSHSLLPFRQVFDVTRKATYQVGSTPDLSLLLVFDPFSILPAPINTA